MKQMIENDQFIIQLVSQLYMQACEFAKDSNYNVKDHYNSVYKKLDQIKIPYKGIQKVTSYNKNDFLQDLIQVTHDMKLTLQNHEKNVKKFINRCRMHFGGEHNKNFQKNIQSTRTKKVVKMYNESNSYWDEIKQKYFLDNVYSNCVYMMGITKGNGVVLDQNKLVSCAHVFINDENNKIMKIRCFSTGSCGYGIVRIQSNGLFKQSDLGFSTIIKYNGPSILSLKLAQQPLVNFCQDFKPVSCVQVGLLFIPEELHETFQTAEGFIERNLYKTKQDLELQNQMGLLIHNCYGMWGTSGSPLWNSNGQLLGLHNAWNQKGHNISMIVHDDDDENQCRVVRQYQRRAIPAHVINILYKKWIQRKNSPQQKQIIQEEKSKKTKKIKKQKRS